MENAEFDVLLRDLDHLRLGMWDELAARHTPAVSIMRLLDRIFAQPVRLLQRLAPTEEVDA